MIGGPDRAVERLDPIFASLAPGVESAERTPGRAGDVSPSENGYLHCGPNGAGHFVKMVHNGIEYGIMAAYAEGLNILKNANAGKVQREADAETAPLDHPEYYQYDLDLPEVAEVWRRGSVIGSWLLDLTAAAMQESPDLSDFAGRVSDSGEGRWTSIAAIDEGVPAPVLTSALLRALLLARNRRLRRQGALGDAQAVRRPRREAELRRDGAAARGRRRREGGGAARGRADRRGRRRGGRRARPVRAGDERRPLALGDAGDPRRTRARCPGTETELFQVDERIASPGSEDRNLTHMVLGLSMDHQSALRPMPVTQRDLEAAAREYEALAAGALRPRPPRPRPRRPHRLAGPRRPGAGGDATAASPSPPASTRTTAA